jgi:putative alpha-1,2-mannosidase
MKVYNLLLSLLISVTLTSAQTKKDYTAYVNPFIGTGGHGHTYPGPALPFGMIQPGPDTRLDGWDGCSDLRVLANPLEWNRYRRLL